MSAPLRVLVTGGSSGLGAAVVDAVLVSGGSAFVLDVHRPRSTAGFELVDVSKVAQVERGVDAAAGAMGGLDAVVTAAGIDRCGSLSDVAPADWEAVIGVNLVGTANVVRAALPHLLQSSGRVVTVSSILGLRAAGDASAYCASKAGVLGFTRAMAAELKGRVGVTAVMPGGMDTPFFDGREPKYAPAPDADLCDPRDVAAVILLALTRPPGCEMREIVVAPGTEPSWP